MDTKENNNSYYDNMKQYSFVINEGFSDFFDRIPAYLNVWGQARQDTENAKQNKNSLINKFHFGNKIYGAFDMGKNALFPKEKGFMNRVKGALGGFGRYGARGAAFDTGYTFAKFLKRLRRHGVPRTP